MLTNKSGAKVEVKYNGIIFEIEPDSNLDVRDFGVLRENIAGVELHIMNKHPKAFTQENLETIGKTDREVESKIEGLKQELEIAASHIEKITKQSDSLRQENKELRADQSGLEKKIRELKEDISNLKAKLKAKDMPEDK